MASYRRRRSVNIDEGIITALAAIAQNSKEKKRATPTGVASRILIGDATPLSSVEMDGRRRGVSMTEAIWLSLRSRAEKNHLNNPDTMERILLGSIPPLTEREISFGNTNAQALEVERMNDEITEGNIAAKYKRAAKIQNALKSANIKVEKTDNKSDVECKKTAPTKPVATTTVLINNSDSKSDDKKTSKKSSNDNPPNVESFINDKSVDDGFCGGVRFF